MVLGSEDLPSDNRKGIVGSLYHPLEVCRFLTIWISGKLTASSSSACVATPRGARRGGRCLSREIL